MTRRSFLLVALAVFQKLDLPAVSWSCPMHPDVIETKKGKCPICGMDLAPVRLAYVWSCPIHSVVEESHAGKCPICRRDLVQVTVSLSFTCAADPKIHRLNPGPCSDGTPAIAQHTPRAHGNHAPQHGGMFFMASDNWHHVEGVYPEAGLFRLYVYDDYSKPLRTDQMKLFSGALTLGTRVILLRAVAEGQYLEARIDRLGLPAELAANVKFKREGPDYHFDFVFHELSKDTDAVAPSSFDIPGKTSEIVTLLSERSRNIRALIQKGAFGEIYVDAFQAKDLALALDLRLTEIPLGQRSAVKNAIEKVVRSAWLLDAAGDLGDRKRIEDAYSVFAAAIDAIVAGFSERKQ